MRIPVKIATRQAAIDAFSAIANPNYRHNGSLGKYIKFLDLYRYNQTIGELTRQKYVDKFSRSAYFNSNMEVIERQPSVLYLKSLIESNKKRDYPKTAKIRDYILKTRGLSFNEIEPAKRSHFIDRIRILFNWY